MEKLEKIGYFWEEVEKERVKQEMHSENRKKKQQRAKRSKETGQVRRNQFDGLGDDF